MFRDEDGLYTAKVADFGYSVQLPQDSSHVVLPRSPIWHAPEIDHYGEFLPTQAIKTDVFSFGLLCLWFLFERQLSGVRPLPDEARSKGLSLDYEGSERALKLLEGRKKTHSLVQLANDLLFAESELDFDTKQRLSMLFSGCLVSNPAVRDINMQRALGHLIPYDYELIQAERTS